MNGLTYQMCSSIVFVALIVAGSVQYAQAQSQTCSQGEIHLHCSLAKNILQVLTSSGEDNYNKVVLCQLYESSSLLAQLGALVSEGIEKLMINQGITADDEDIQGIEKRKHEYLRFGKRKHEYLRFGKRKHEYLRFGRK